MAALDTNVLLRFLLQDDAAQAAAAARLIRATGEAGDTLYVPLSVALELEWVLRSRFKMNRAAVVQTFFGLLETVELRFAAAGAVEWALNRYEETGADFGDCMHTALASLAGEVPMWTFDKTASKLPGAALLA
jgi:predicted nucleic-acid-binding protein